MEHREGKLKIGISCPITSIYNLQLHRETDHTYSGRYAMAYATFRPQLFCLISYHFRHIRYPPKPIFEPDTENLSAARLNNVIPGHDKWFSLEEKFDSIFCCILF